jgi:putative NIF3 family GTP cyclohydrolase 1 type 2
MKAIDVYNHLKSKGKWVNWSHTCDRFLFGDENTEITGIGVAWMPTFPNLKKAYDAKCNLFVTHEPLYVGKMNKYGVFVGGPVVDKSHLENMDNFNEGKALEEDDIWIKKTEWLEAHKMTVLRCHDVWDDYPEIGIHGAWAKWLGFNEKPIKQVKFYEVHSVKDRTLKSVVEQISSKVKSLGQDCVHYIGDLNQKVSRIALGTGAITDYRLMHDQLEADVLVITDDGTRLWESGQWSEDSGIPIIIVNHATAEEPGVRAMAKYIGEQFPKIAVKAIERGCLYRSL